MLKIATDIRDTDYPRLLKLRRMLRPLRPIRLEVVRRELLDARRAGRALSLLEAHFPGYLRGYQGGRGFDWTDVLGDLLRCCEAEDWLEADWSNLDDQYNAWAYGDEDETMDEFAEYPTFIPARCFGFSPEDELLWEDNPAALVLAAVLTEKVELESGYLIDMLDDAEVSLGLFDGLTNHHLWHRLEHADFTAYPEPLCWLPDVCKVIDGSTGNYLLDSSRIMWDRIWHTWDNDLEFIKAQWQEAKPVAERLAKFLEWSNEPGERIRPMLEALTGRSLKESEDDDEGEDESS